MFQTQVDAIEVIVPPPFKKITSQMLEWISQTKKEVFLGAQNGVCMWR